MYIYLLFLIRYQMIRKGKLLGTVKDTEGVCDVNRLKLYKGLKADKQVDWKFVVGILNCPHIFISCVSHKNLLDEPCTYGIGEVLYIHAISKYFGMKFLQEYSEKVLDIYVKHKACILVEVTHQWATCQYSYADSKDKKWFMFMNKKKWEVFHQTMDLLIEEKVVGELKRVSVYNDKGKEGCYAITADDTICIFNVDYYEDGKNYSQNTHILKKVSDDIPFQTIFENCFDRNYTSPGGIYAMNDASVMVGKILGKDTTVCTEYVRDLSIRINMWDSRDTYVSPGYWEMNLSEYLFSNMLILDSYPDDEDLVYKKLVSWCKEKGIKAPEKNIFEKYIKTQFD